MTLLNILLEQMLTASASGYRWRYNIEYAFLSSKNRSQWLILSQSKPVLQRLDRAITCVGGLASVNIWGASDGSVA